VTATRTNRTLRPVALLDHRHHAAHASVLRGKLDAATSTTECSLSLPAQPVARQAAAASMRSEQGAVVEPSVCAKKPAPLAVRPGPAEVFSDLDWMCRRRGHRAVLYEKHTGDDLSSQDSGYLAQSMLAEVPYLLDATDRHRSPKLRH